MSFARTTVLLTAATLLALIALAGPTQADTGVLEESGVEVPAPTHAIGALSAGDFLFEMPLGTVTCNQVSVEATIDEAHVNGPTEVGSINSLDFLNSGSQNCPTDIFGISTCNPTVDVPIHIGLDPNNPGTAQLVFVDQEVHVACTTILGGLECHYASPSITAAIGVGTNEMTLDAHLALTAGGGLCPSEGVAEATIGGEDESANPITYESTK